jgi:hypothetical protein
MLNLNICLILKEKMGNCLECGVNIIGRIDKKFCSDGCRNSFHNRVYREESSGIRVINRVLARNHRLLKNLFDNNERECFKERLTELGFNFSYFTSIEEKASPDKHYFCYDFEYFCTSDKFIYITQIKLLKK